MQVLVVGAHTPVEVDVRVEGPHARVRRRVRDDVLQDGAREGGIARYLQAVPARRLDRSPVESGRALEHGSVRRCEDVRRGRLLVEGCRSAEARSRDYPFAVPVGRREDDPVVGSRLVGIRPRSEPGSRRVRRQLGERVVDDVREVGIPGDDDEVALRSQERLPAEERHRGRRRGTSRKQVVAAPTAPAEHVVGEHAAPDGGPVQTKAGLSASGRYVSALRRTLRPRRTRGRAR